ncbi:glycoside hydrolase family 28 protein [Paenibacillus sp. TRM 82003]|nr:glycoside hydrolase family 28 protein [Paenibacillus sp. TRM 82003]
MHIIDVQVPVIPDRVFDITDFGAVGDGIHDNSEAFEAALSACEEAGGGKIVIPAGIWFTGPIRLRSRTELHTSAGALVRFSPRFDDYPLIPSTYEGLVTVRCRSPIDGERLEDVAITGGGVFDASGEAWRPVKRYKMTAQAWEALVASGGVVDEAADIWWPTERAMRGRALVEKLIEADCQEPAAFEEAHEYLRPNLLSLRQCKRVLLEGPTFQNSPAWCLHPWACEHVTIRGVTVRNPWFSQNGDGLDLDSCRYALVEDCSFDVGDDAICMKSGKDKRGRELGLPCEHVLIRGCRVYHGHGGFVIGSEMSGGVRDVTIEDCLFMGTDIGLRFKSARGRGGVVEDIRISDIRMIDIVHEAISFHLFYEGKEGSGDAMAGTVPVTEETPVFRNIEMKRITCSGAKKALLVNGLAELPVEGLRLEGFDYRGRQGIICTNLVNASLKKLKLQVEEGPPVTLHACENVEVDCLPAD